MQNVVPPENKNCHLFQVFFNVLAKFCTLLLVHVNMFRTVSDTRGSPLIIDLCQEAFLWFLLAAVRVLFIKLGFDVILENTLESSHSLDVFAACPLVF